MEQIYENVDLNIKEGWKEYWSWYVTGTWSEVRTGVICGVLSWWEFFVFFAHIKLIHSVVVMSCIITESIKTILVKCLVGPCY